MKNILLCIALLTIMCVMVGCSTKIENKNGLNELIGHTYNNCKIKTIIRKDDETLLTCLYNDEKMVIDLYTAEQTEEQIRDELLDILASNEVYWNTLEE